MTFLIVTVCVFLITSDNQVRVMSPPPMTHRRKTILYWHSMFSHKDYQLGLGAEMFSECPHKNCITTNNRSYLPLDQYDALVFHGGEYVKEKHGLPPIRTPNQVYIFANLESPRHLKPIEKYDNFYNWTMTYRTDSDVFRPYGRIERKRTDYQPPSLKEIQGRPKKMAWFVSRCHAWSYRENLKQALDEYFPIDVYGACGNLTCPKSSSDDCYEMLETTYKFYLSFENSFCVDYVTEKLFFILQRNIIPVVYGGANYSKFAPPNSVIDVTKFDSLESLVKYIKFLDENPAEYVKYFEWKKDYVSVVDYKPTICALCEKMNEVVQTRVYEDLGRYWEGTETEKKCNNSFIIDFLNIK